MNPNIKIAKLSKDEAGKLRGGFAIQSAKIESHLGATNGNCNGGGWFDTNTNCTSACTECSVMPQQPTTGSGTVVTRP